MVVKTFRNRWTWGFSEGAESWNGRLAMLAFVLIFILEFFFFFCNSIYWNRIVLQM